MTPALLFWLHYVPNRTLFLPLGARCGKNFCGRAAIPEVSEEVSFATQEQVTSRSGDLVGNDRYEISPPSFVSTFFPDKYRVADINNRRLQPVDSQPML